MDRKYVRPRIPLDLADRIDLVRGGVPFERWVRETLERAVRPAHVTIGSVAFTADYTGRVETQEAEIHYEGPADAAPRFRCPAPGCDFAPASPKAHCPAHGRTVVPVT